MKEQELKKDSPYGLKFTLTIFDENGESFVCQSKIFKSYEEAFEYKKKNHTYSVQIGTVIVSPPRQPQPVEVK
jgi:C4-type Zn-finger protein